jgi:hypothetical protein
MHFHRERNRDSSITVPRAIIGNRLEHCQCDSLASKTVHGFLPPAQKPSSAFPAERKLVISGELEPDWVCNFFLQQRRGAAIIIAGSCLSAGIPLGKIGDLDPMDGGAFEMTIPDFTRDPLFNCTGDVPRFGTFGEIVPCPAGQEDRPFFGDHQAGEYWTRIRHEHPKRVSQSNNLRDATMINLVISKTSLSRSLTRIGQIFNERN